MKVTRDAIAATLQAGTFDVAVRNFHTQKHKGTLGQISSSVPRRSALKNASPLFLCGAPQSIPSVAKNCFISCVFIPYLTILCQENMAVFKALFHILIERITLRKFCDHFLCFRFGIRRSIRYNQLDRLSDHFHIRRNQSSGCKGCCSKADSAGNSP